MSNLQGIKRLAEMMVAKARLLENTIERALTSDEETQENTSIRGQYESFKHILIRDLTLKGFADIYAQTLAYGMFAVRLHDPTLDDILKTEFDIKDGLADTSKTKIKVKTQTQDKRTASGYKEVEKEVRKVQILDPATGTGTFLAAVVKHIYNSKFTSVQFSKELCQIRFYLEVFVLGYKPLVQNWK